MEDIMGIMVGGLAVFLIFLGLPWLVFHYVTKWKTIGSLTGEDEKLLDELHYSARQLEERLMTVERIIAADHPDFRPLRDVRPEASPFDISRRN